MHCIIKMACLPIQERHMRLSNILTATIKSYPYGKTLHWLLQLIYFLFVLRKRHIHSSRSTLVVILTGMQDFRVICF